MAARAAAAVISASPPSTIPTIASVSEWPPESESGPVMLPCPASIESVAAAAVTATVGAGSAELGAPIQREM